MAISARNKIDLQAVADEINALSCRALVVTCDVTEPEQARRVVATVVDDFCDIDSSIADIVNKTGMSKAEVEQFNPQSRLIEPEEVATVALLPAQDVSKGITGQAINVDGGAVMW